MKPRRTFSPEDHAERRARTRQAPADLADLDRTPAWQRPPRRACPSCGTDMRVKLGRRGHFWSCKAYPVCRKTVDIDQARYAAWQQKHNVKL